MRLNAWQKSEWEQTGRSARIGFSCFAHLFHFALYHRRCRFLFLGQILFSCAFPIRTFSILNTSPICFSRRGVTTENEKQSHRRPSILTVLVCTGDLCLTVLLNAHRSYIMYSMFVSIFGQCESNRSFFFFARLHFFPLAFCCSFLFGFTSVGKAAAHTHLYAYKMNKPYYPLEAHTTDIFGLRLAYRYRC